MNNRIDTKEKIQNLKNIEAYLCESNPFAEYSFNFTHINLYSMTNDIQIVSGLISSFLAIHYSHMSIEEFKTFFEKEETIGIYDYCNKCENKINYLINKTNKTIAEIDIPCKFVSSFEFKISFPTGKIFMCDYLRTSKDPLDIFNNNENINYNGERKTLSLIHSKNDIVHLFTGGTALTVDKTQNGIILREENTDEINEDVVYGDLRWVTLFDVITYSNLLKTQFKSNYERLNKEFEDIFNNPSDGQLLIDIEPGNYRVTYNSNPVYITLEKDK